MKQTIRSTSRTVLRRGAAIAGLVSIAAISGCASSSEPVSGSPGEGALVVYSGDANADAYIAAFNEEHPDIKVDLITGNTGELLSRVQSEAGKPQGDVYWAGGDPGLTNPELFEKLPGRFQDGILEEFRLESGYGVPFNGFLNAFVYNTDLVDEDDAPQSWADLADPQWQGKIYLANPTSSGSGYSAMSDWVTVGGWDLVEDIAKNIVVVEGTFAPFQAVTGGEAAIGIANEGFLAYLETDNVEFVNPSDGAGITKQALLKIKDGPNPDNAETFIEWLVSEDAQTLMTETQPGARPVIDGLDASGVPALSDVEVIEQDGDATAKHDEWVERWQEIITSL
ncbi:ABC transporter substrate-binding protein [Microbacterium sp.]|uniref:ABC transporter substrate-binding protein n=1 Tax=Microbacterium sp. TaxID=51671 RepID=UPI0028116E1A|nr:extracellular solute-binding protein [Microbacterium sp.]